MGSYRKNTRGELNERKGILWTTRRGCHIDSGKEFRF